MKQKALITITVLIFIFLLSPTNISGVIGEVYAWDDCPKGLVNDEYPGSCPSYIDTDENGICDHSEPAPEDRIGNQDLNEETEEKQTENPIILAGNKETENTLNKGIVSFLSIFIPLTALVGYASVYKIKQGKKL